MRSERRIKRSFKINKSCIIFFSVCGVPHCFALLLNGLNWSLWYMISVWAVWITFSFFLFGVMVTFFAPSKTEGVFFCAIRNSFLAQPFRDGGIMYAHLQSLAVRNHKVIVSLILSSANLYFQMLNIQQKYWRSCLYPNLIASISKILWRFCVFANVN